MAAVFPGFPGSPGASVPEEASVAGESRTPAGAAHAVRARGGGTAPRAPESPAGERHPADGHGHGALVDQCGYGVLAEELGIGDFERRLAEATGCAVPAAGTVFDSAVGLALRRWCPPLLGLEPYSTPARYLARRRELGACAATRALLYGSGIECFLVVDADAGADAGAAADASNGGGERSGAARELAASAHRPVRATVALEPLAERVADVSDSVRSFVTGTADALHKAAREAAAFVCGAEFREPGPPGLPEVHRAADRWLRARACAGAETGPSGGVRSGGGGGARWRGGHERTAVRTAARTTAARIAAYGRPPLPGAPVHATSLHAEPALVRHVLWSALVTGRPVQLSCGDPMPLAGFLRAGAGPRGTVVLLARHPHHPAAARLAAAFPHVYADAGPRPAEALAEAPFGKLLFSTRARILPELYVVRAREFAAGLRRTLAGWVAEGRCGAGDARRIARLVAGGNARRLYGLAGEAGAG
jgi:uncharacterized protein